MGDCVLNCMIGRSKLICNWLPWRCVVDVDECVKGSAECDQECFYGDMCVIGCHGDV
jgi:hypothetical protein